jgi:hypothetical protein
MLHEFEAWSAEFIERSRNAFEEEQRANRLYVDCLRQRLGVPGGGQAAS